MNTDQHFLTGKQHINSGLPCQDYALSGQLSDTVAYAIVSDGCSSGARTDVGSRIVALATQKALHTIPYDRLTPELVSHYQQSGIESAKSLFNLDVSDMLATCLYGVVSPLGALVHIQGDGVVAYKMKNGDIQIDTYEWEGNTPYYPAYAYDGNQSFISHHGGDLSRQKVVSKRLYVSFEGEVLSESSEIFSLGEGINGFEQKILPQQLGDIEYIAVCSDGVEQVQNLSSIDVISSLLAFKNTSGVFATRRLNRCIKDWEKSNSNPMDDIAYAVIHVSENFGGSNVNTSNDTS